jgi:hypothetical protein
VVAIEGTGRGQRVDEFEPGGGAVHFGDGDRSVQFDDRRRKAFGENRIEARDASPIGVLGAGGHGVDGGDSALQGVAARRQIAVPVDGVGASERGEAAADQQLVPAASLLICQ